MIKSEAFPSKWLKAADLKGRPCVLEIKSAVQETVKFKSKEQRKTVLYFEGTGKGLDLNVTNWDAVVEITGQSDSDDWAGHVIEIFPTTTEVDDKTVDCIRIRAPEQADMLAAAKAPNLPSAPEEPPKGDMDDNIPF